MMSGGEDNKLVTPCMTPPQLDPPPGDEALGGEFASPAPEAAAANSSCCKKEDFCLSWW